MKIPRTAGVRPALRRTGGLLCAVAGLLLSACEGLHPDIVKGYTVGEAERAAASAEGEAVTQPTEDAALREQRAQRAEAATDGTLLRRPRRPKRGPRPVQPVQGSQSN